MRAAAKIGLKTSDFNQSSRPLRRDSRLRSNPGALRMFTYVRPRSLRTVRSCGRASRMRADGGGDRSRRRLVDARRAIGFALLLPEQQAANNPNGCFNWFQPGDTERGRGEAALDRQMIEKIVLDNGMTPPHLHHRAVGRRCHDLGHARDATPKSLPQGHHRGPPLRHRREGAGRIPKHVSGPTALRRMGGLVRRASQHQRPWPRISVWHGGMDTSDAVKRGQIVKQWTDVHGYRQIQPSGKPWTLIRGRFGVMRRARI